MKQSADQTHAIEQEALALLREALSPSAQVSANGLSKAGAVVQLQGGEQIPLEFVLWTREEGARRSGAHTVWVHPRATRELRDRLRREQESYVDLRGAVYLSLPHLLVDRVNLALPSRPKTVPRKFDPFADRSSLVVRTLLEEEHDRIWGLRELAEAAGVGPATATRIVRELERYQVVRVQRAGRESEIRLTDAHALFALWTSAYDWTRNPSITVQAPVGDPLRFLRRSSHIFGPHRWALTLQAGASLVAPHATWERIHAYVDVPTADALLKIAEQQDWPVGDEGKLVLMKPYYRDSAWHGAREMEGLPVVSDLQLALDLWRYPLRGREQAEHLISTQHLLS